MPTTVIGVLCFIGFTMYDGLKYKAQYETAQARLSSLESRLRPHFLFNTLNSIMALIPDDPAAAERVTERLATLLRYSLDATGHSTVRLEQELKVATDYLEIEKTRFGDRLRYTIDVPETLMLRPHVLSFLDVASAFSEGGGLEIETEQLHVSKESSLCNRTLEEARVRQAYGLIVLALKKAAGDMLFNPEGTTRVENGDVLIAMLLPKRSVE